MKLPEAEKCIKDCVIDNMNNELQTLSSSSILKNTNPNDLTLFSLKDFEKELIEKAPDTIHMLKIICISKRKQKRNGNLEQGESSLETVISTIAAMVLHSRCPELSALAYRIGLIVRFSGAGRMVRVVFFNEGKFVFKENPYQENPPQGKPSKEKCVEHIIIQYKTDGVLNLCRNYLE